MASFPSTEVYIINYIQNKKEIRTFLLPVYAKRKLGKIKKPTNKNSLRAILATR